MLDDSAFDGCDVVVEGDIVNQRVACLPMEGRAIAASWKDGKLTVWASTQNAQLSRLILTAVGLPAAYVPYPVGNGEQRFNAMPIVAAGGGLLRDDHELTADWIRTAVVPLLTDPGALDAMSDAAARFGSRDADVVLARRVLAVAAEHRRSPGPAQ